MKRLALLATVTITIGLAGCESERPTESQLPGAQPQAWEQTLPGMSGMGTGVAR